MSSRKEHTNTSKSFSTGSVTRNVDIERQPSRVFKMAALPSVTLSAKKCKNEQSFDWSSLIFCSPFRSFTCTFILPMKLGPQVKKEKSLAICKIN